MDVTGADTYNVAYTYDIADRLLKDVKTAAQQDSITDYYYDANGNRISKCMSSLAPANSTTKTTLTLSDGTGLAEIYHYNGFNQLVSGYVNAKDISYALQTRWFAV